MSFGAQEKMRLVFALRSKGVTDGAVLKAMERVDRAEFVGDTFADRAYDDVPLPIASGQTISQPSVVGIMTQALMLERRHKVLEIGTGSGYQAVILAQLARRVYTVERASKLVAQAQALIARKDITNITAVLGDGCWGLPEQAPFDRILVTAATEDPPSPLMAQLRDGGVMVLPVGQSDTVQTLIRVTRRGDSFDYDELRAVRFVPLTEGIARD